MLKNPALLILVIALAFLVIATFPLPRMAIAPSADSHKLTPTSMVTSTIDDWGTYTNLEDFYSIQYPDRGNFSVRYTAEPKRTILYWNNPYVYDVEIYFIDADGLNLQQWLASNDATTTNMQSTVIDGINGVTEYWPSAGTLTAYVARDIAGAPFIYQIDFVCFAYPVKPCPPRFWQQMLSSFRTLPAEN